MGRFLLTQMAAVAELEAGLIGERTKNALAAAKKRIARTGQRGRPDIKRLGNPNGAHALKGKQVGNADAVAKLKATAVQRAADLKAIVEDIRRSGITTVRGIADELQARGIRAPRGDLWHPTAVSRLLTRIEGAGK
jgi:DNA invertase Pin-like site-specific DNA recombinase